MDAAGTALPSILWVVVVVGAVISLSSSFFFKVEDARLHQIMVLLLATFIGLVIFMIFALDRRLPVISACAPIPIKSSTIN
jgi:hypothetical protein